MKRFLTLAAILLCGMVFFSCSKTGTCQLCNKENVELQKVEAEGETYMVCDECAMGVEFLKSLSEGLSN